MEKLDSKLIEWYIANEPVFRKNLNETESMYKYIQMFPFQTGVLKDSKVYIVAEVIVDIKHQTCKNFLRLTRGDISGTIQCIHFGIDISSEEFFDIMHITDEEEQKKLILEKTRSNEKQQLSMVNVNPLDQFISLCSYASGLAELGAEGIIQLCWTEYDEQTQQYILPVGFNSAFTSQFTKILKYIVPEHFTKLLEQIFKEMLFHDRDFEIFKKSFPALDEAYSLKELSERSMFFRRLIKESGVELK